MRNFYQKSVMSIFMLAIMSLIGVNSLQAQEKITWKGSVSTNALIEDNWEPAMGIEGNHIFIPHLGEYADPDNPNHPVVESDTEITVEQIEIDHPYSFEEEQVDGDGQPILDDDGAPVTALVEYPAGSLTVRMADGVAFKTSSNSTGAYMQGTLAIESGVFEANRPLFFERDGAKFVVSGTSKAYVHGNRFFIIGDRNGGTGAQVVVEDEGYLEINHADGISRWHNLPHSTVTVKDNGKIAVANNYTEAYVGRIENNQLLGGDNHYPHLWYDVPTNKTNIIAIPNDMPWIYFADRSSPRTERLLAEEEGAELAIELSSFRDYGTKFEWKFGTTPEGPFDQVLVENADAQNIKPAFSTSGTLYLVCEVTVGSDVYQSNVLEYQIASNKLIPNFAGKQYLRGPQVGGEIVFEVDGELTEGSAEWKWSTTSGSGYQSFDPAVKGLEYAPDFDEVGVYFVVLEAEVDGEVQSSLEIEVERQALSAGPLPLIWTAAVDEDFGNMFNWTPHAYPNKNNVEIKPDAGTLWPVFTAGTDTIMNGSVIGYKAAVMDGEEILEPEVKAQLIVRASENDTLQLRGDSYGLHGILKVESGVFLKENNLLRFEHNSSEIQVTGTGVVIFDKWNDDNSSLCFGNSNDPTRGGQIYMSGNGKMIFEPVAAIFRLTTNPDADFSKMHLQDNAEMIFIGDYTSAIATFDKNNRFVLGEDYVLSNLYDEVTNYTYVSARNLNDFAIANDETQYVSIDQPITKLTLANVDGLETFTWKYSTGALGPWADFADPIVGDEAALVFENVGEFYVAAEASDGTLTSNVVKIVVMDFKVMVDDEEGVYTLSVELPDGAKEDGGAWVVKAPGATEYENSDYADEGLEYELDGWQFEEGDGEYIISYKAIYVDEEENDIDIFATPARVVVENGEITVVDTAVGIKGAKAIVAGVYPNPNNGTFTLSVDADVYTVEVIDLAGNVISKAQLSGANNTITLSNSGVYIVRVTTSERSTVQRVIVK